MTFFLLFCAGDGRYWQICSPFYLPCSQTLSVRRLIPLAECFLTGWSSFLLKEEEEEEEESAVVLIGGHLLNPVGNRLRRQRHPWPLPEAFRFWSRSRTDRRRRQRPFRRLRWPRRWRRHRSIRRKRRNGLRRNLAKTTWRRTCGRR